MRIAHVVRRMVPDEWGGIETMITAIGSRQQDRGHEIRVLATAARSRSGPDEVAGIPVVRFAHHYPVLGLSADARADLDRLGGNPLVPGLFRHLERAWRPDLIHCHTPERLAAAAIRSGRRLGAPVVLSLHGGLDAGAAAGAPVRERPPATFNWGRFVDPFLGTRRVLQRVDALLPVSSDDAERLTRELPGRRIVRLPNGVDATRFSSGNGARFRRRNDIPLQAPLVLVMARIVPQKGQLLAVRAHALLVREWPDAHLVLAGPVGDPAYAALVTQAALSAGTRGRIRIIPGLCHGSESFRDLFDAADISWLPSRYEPFGIAVLEAWAARVPVVTSRAGELSKLVRHGHDGITIPGDDAAAYAQATGSLLSRPEHARALAAAGQAAALRDYSWDAAVDTLEHLYASLLGKTRDARCRTRSAARQGLAGAGATSARPGGLAPSTSCSPAARPSER